MGSRPRDKTPEAGPPVRLCRMLGFLQLGSLIPLQSASIRLVSFFHICVLISVKWDMFPFWLMVEMGTIRKSPHHEHCPQTALSFGLRVCGKGPSGGHSTSRAKPKCQDDCLAYQHGPVRGRGVVAGANLRRKMWAVSGRSVVRILRLSVEAPVYSRGGFRLYRREQTSQLQAYSLVACR